MQTRPTRFAVTVNGMKIGAIRRLGLDRWIFNSILPGNPGRTRTPRPFNAIEQAVRRRFANVRINPEDNDFDTKDKFVHLLEKELETL